MQVVQVGCKWWMWGAVGACTDVQSCSQWDVGVVLGGTDVVGPTMAAPKRPTEHSQGQYGYSMGCLDNIVNICVFLFFRPKIWWASHLKRIFFGSLCEYMGRACGR